KLIKAIFDLDTRRNQLAPISKLSPELLSEIFLIIAAYSRISADHPSYLPPAEARICTNGVCHYWRDVALGCASLWSYIDFSWDTPKRVRESLARSKSTPLVVQASLHCPQALSNILLALKEISRIQCLDLGFTATLFSFFDQSLLNPAPALEVLRLDCDLEVSLSAAIFAHQTPRLRELELRGCAIPKDSHLLRNALTYLSVDELPPDETFTVLEWLDILQSLPLLEVLSLSNCFSPPQEIDHSLPLVHLPQLFSLELVGCIEECADALNHLVFPPTPCLEIKCYSAQMTTDTALTDTLGKILKQLPAVQKLRAMGISWRPDGLTFCASVDENGDISTTSESSEFCFALLDDDATHLPFSLTLAILAALPTTDITVLDLGIPRRHCPWPPSSHWLFQVEDDDWPALLRLFPRVHTLQRIQYDWAAVGLALLIPSPASVLLPSLHTLAFTNTAFDIPAIIPNLMVLLRRRAEEGRPVRELRIDCC
ncbi:hypothetical protein DFH06DRAFT_1438840, partial [Mycena polygramma]